MILKVRMKVIVIFMGIAVTLIQLYPQSLSLCTLTAPEPMALLGKN